MYQTLDLLTVIGYPLPDGVSFTEGLHDKPAYHLDSETNIGHLAFIIFPPDFSESFSDFTILVTLKPESDNVGPLLVVTESQQITIILGLNISQEGTDRHRITLYMRDLSDMTANHEAASFVVPSLTNRWSQFSLSVIEDMATLFFNCSTYTSQSLRRPPGWKLTIPHGAAVFVGSQGFGLKEKMSFMVFQSIYYWEEFCVCEITLFQLKQRLYPMNYWSL